MKINIRNCLYIIILTMLITTIVIIDLMTVIYIVISSVEKNITINDLLSELGGIYKGAPYTKGAGVIAALVAEVPIIIILIREIKKTNIN